MFSNFTELSKAMEKSGERSGKFCQYVCPPVRLGSYPPVAARRPPLEALSGERRRQTNMQRKARKQLAGAAAAAAARRPGGVAPGANSAPAPSVRRRKLQHPVVEWIMSPCQNFEQDSDSDSAEHKVRQSSSRSLSAVVSRRQLESRTYIVPSQRIMEVAALKKAQVWPLLAKKERLEQQTMVRETQVETQPLGETSIESEVLVEPELELTVGQTHSSWSSTSQPQETEEQEARAWSKVRLIAGSSKAIKLTSTVIKIIPNAPPPIATESKQQTDAKARAGSRKQQRANADPFEEPTSVLLMVSEPPKPPPVVQRLSRSCPPKSTQKMPGPRPKLNQVSMARPQSQSQSAAPAATVPPSTNSKIVRKAQHKVPRTAEDGIDMSYQYFVSIPLKRGKKPQAVRYLHQSLVKSLNPTVRHSCGQRIKKKKAQQCEKEEQMDENPLKAAEAEAEPQPELGPEEELEAKPFQEPTLKLDRKYMPMLQLLTQMPYPTQTETEPQPKKDLQETTKDPQESSGDQQVAKSNRQLARTDRQVPGAKPQKRRTSMRLLPPKRSVLVDYKPEATRLESIAGAQISYHTPVRFMRRLAGGEAHKRRTSPVEAQRQQKEHTEQPMDRVERVQKSVSFQLSETKSSSSSIPLTGSAELKIDVPEPEPVPVPAPVRGQSKSPKKLSSSKKQTKSTNKMKKFSTK
ncbi:serine/arginine repetitive matrix protein 1 isoform X2 [Drosophila subobscura]|uniref:serine/arginine repetitive matrix protein 1 isoform X2 n=1 Tax=Drosophila subobscura TaxID=7241 RepID=UPI00155AF32F|nr:serine/arginine repetitive matrix protein 1 isoform X2 [Drosophila subobscura]